MTQGSDTDALLQVYRAMLMARMTDRIQQDLTARGEAFFYVTGAGHEAVAALAPHLGEQDWLHCHYRDLALMFARGVHPRAYLIDLLAREGSSSRGRQMAANFCDRGRHILSPPIPVGNGALQAVGVAAAVRDEPGRPIVLCSVGDGTTQQGEYLEAIAEACRDHLPVLFLIEDNTLALSSPTRGKTFFSGPRGDAEAIFGITLRRINGRDAAGALHAFGEVVSSIREERGPAIVILDVDRLDSHSNADDQRLYRSVADVESIRLHGDPLPRLEQTLIAGGCDTRDLEALRNEVQTTVAAAGTAALDAPDPEPAYEAMAPLPAVLTSSASENRGNESDPQMTMRDAICATLDVHLGDDLGVFLYGQDIEDPKGDVFGITRGLSSRHPGRVRNSPLSESTIVGTCIGRALAGQRPVALIQFADFLSLAQNQLSNELATMYWRTDGHWSAAVIVLAPCGGYRPGLGHFHAQTPDAAFAHIPGLDVFVPSTAADAAGLLNAAFQSGRPTLFMYPKAMLSDRSIGASGPIDAFLVPIGKARTVQPGEDITLVAWGNCVALCRRAAEALRTVDMSAEVIDLRSLSPWDSEAVLLSATKTGRLLVVHEDNRTGGFGAEILATVAEHSPVPVRMRREARADTLIPYDLPNHLAVLPSFRSVLGAVADMLDLEVSWIMDNAQASELFEVQAIGTAPSDETVTVLKLLIAVGDAVLPGDPVAEVEATKAAFEITSPVAGTVTEWCVATGDDVKVGGCLMKIRVEESLRRKKAVVIERPGEPVLTRR